MWNFYIIAHIEKKHTSSHLRNNRRTCGHCETQSPPCVMVNNTHNHKRSTNIFSFSLYSIQVCFLYPISTLYSLPFAHIVKHVKYFDFFIDRLPLRFGSIRSWKVIRKLVSTHQTRYDGAWRIEVLHHAHEAHKLAHHRGDPAVSRLALAPYICTKEREDNSDIQIRIKRLMPKDQNCKIIIITDLVTIIVK